MDYYPLLTSELERNYEILNNLNFKLLNVYGSIGCGKTTIVKLYLKNKKYYYIEDYNQSLESFIEHINKLTSIDIISYFTNNLEKSIIVIDNYDYYNYKYKDYARYLDKFTIIIISNVKYFDNSLYIEKPTDEYLLSLLNSINYLYDKNYEEVNLNASFTKFVTSIESRYLIDFDNFYTEIDCFSEIYESKNLNLNFYDINSFQCSYINYINTIHKNAFISSEISNSITLIGTDDYYQFINNILITLLDSKIISIKKSKLNYHKRLKILNECKKYSVVPEELSLVKKIKN